MNGADLTTALLTLAIQETPTIISGIKTLFAQKNPTAPPLTDSQVFAALNAAYLSSLAKDDAILNHG
jgi:hypothetical protein